MDNIIQTNMPYTYRIMMNDTRKLKNRYHFLDVGIIGYTVLERPIPYIKIGIGKKEVLYCGSFHANEWITTPVLMEFLADYCYSYTNNLDIFDYNAKELFESASIYIVPMVNPDGVDLVAGGIPINSPTYKFAQNIASNFLNIEFPNGWKSNIRGVDLNLQFPAGWEQAQKIKYAQGFFFPAPRDFVGYGPLTEPESLALYNFTLQHNFKLILAYHTQGEVI